MQRQKPKTYDAKIDGCEVRVTVPEDQTPQETLIVALQDSLSPQAVAAIVAFLQPARTASENVNTQIRWFADVLVETVGGHDAISDLCDEVGL